MGTLIAVINRKGNNATKAAVNMLQTLKGNNIEAYGIASHAEVCIEKSIENLQKKDLHSPIVIGYAFSKILPKDKPQPIPLENASLVLEGRIYEKNGETCDVEIAAKYKDYVENLILKHEGCFALVLAEKEKIVACRDAIGAVPIYYGENQNFVALASEKKALWKIGISNIQTFPTGHLAIVGQEGFEFEKVHTLYLFKEKPMNMQTTSEKLQKLLKKAINQKISGLSEVAVAFSGGLDSSLIAFLTKNFGVKTHLIGVSLKNQKEIAYMKKAAAALNLPLHLYLYEEEDVAKILSKVLWLIEEPDPMKVGVGIPFFWTAENARELGFRVLLSGQGADELFGGYERYVTEYSKYGKEKLRQTFFNDITRMHETNFERDYKICNFHGVELRLPFASYELAKLAIEMPTELKIDMACRDLRKLVLRHAAKNLGLPNFIAERPKRAIQYATGVAESLKRIAHGESLSLREYLESEFKKIMAEKGA